MMRYTIVTPTKNEAPYIEKTIFSVINQQVLPEEWLIMDDGSTDETAAIIQKHAAIHPFIKYFHLNNYRPELVNTGGRVAAIINHGDTLREKPIDIIVKLDADTSFQPDFFLNLMNEFTQDEKLGGASGHLCTDGVPEKITDRRGCRGATLLIRYTCFEQIGKFYVSKTRGEDVLAGVAIRAIGYKTGTFDYYFDHLKPEGIRASKPINHYITGYYKGSVPYWLPFFLATIIRDFGKKPYVIGGFMALFAYILSRYIHRYRPFPSFVTAQMRMEQQKKLLKKQ